MDPSVYNVCAILNAGADFFLLELVDLNISSVKVVH